MFRQRDSSLEKGLKVAIDLVVFFLAANLAFDLRYYVDWHGILGSWVKEGPAPWGALYQAMPYLLLGWFVIFGIFGLYRSNLKFREEFILILKAQAVAFVVMFATTFFYRGFSYSRGAALFLMPLSFVFTLGARRLFVLVKEQLFRLPAIREAVLIVGRNEDTEHLIEKLKQPDNPFEPVGILATEDFEPIAGVRRLGGPQELGKCLTRREIQRVLLVSGALARPDLVEAIETCTRHRVAWVVVPDLYDLVLDRLRMEKLAGIPVLGPPASNIVGLNLAVKRCVDMVMAAMLLLISSPVLLLSGLLVKATSKGPMLFVQKRVGRQGRIFQLVKFRTMVTESNDKRHRKFMEQVIKNGQTEEKTNGSPVYKEMKDPRITFVGRWLRRFSVDELPQLFNVLRGDMSLVGPRPAVPYEVKLYTDRHKRRLEAPPGITGLWQVSGRNRLSFEEMVELDIHYIENWSVSLDIRIFFKTIGAVLFSRGY